jgi:hypothetical protein
LARTRREIKRTVTSGFPAGAFGAAPVANARTCTHTRARTRQSHRRPNDERSRLYARANSVTAVAREPIARYRTRRRTEIPDRAVARIAKRRSIVVDVSRARANEVDRAYLGLARAHQWTE